MFISKILISIHFNVHNTVLCKYIATNVYYIPRQMFRLTRFDTVYCRAGIIIIFFYLNRTHYHIRKHILSVVKLIKKWP